MTRLADLTQDKGTNMLGSFLSLSISFFALIIVSSTADAEVTDVDMEEAYYAYRSLGPCGSPNVKKCWERTRHLAIHGDRMADYLIGEWNRLELEQERSRSLKLLQDLAFTQTDKALYFLASLALEPGDIQVVNAALGALVLIRDPRAAEIGRTAFFVAEAWIPADEKERVQIPALHVVKENTFGENVARSGPTYMVQHGRLTLVGPEKKEETIEWLQGLRSIGLTPKVNEELERVLRPIELDREKRNERGSE